jgi:uncharacterized membrane protein
MSNEKARMQILEMIENGQISAEDGVRLLQALGPAPAELPEASPEFFPSSPANLADTPAAIEHANSEAEALPVHPARAAEIAEEDDATPGLGEQAVEPGATARSESLPAEARRWKRWWMIPLWIGVAITVSGGFLMYLAVDQSGIGLGFLCAGVPFLIGLALLVLAWQSRTAPWLHLRVQQKPGERPQRIAFSFPIPIRPTVWLLRTFGSNIKEVDDLSLDEMLIAVGDKATPENPIYIQVDEGDQGEKVEIYIG